MRFFKRSIIFIVSACVVFSLLPVAVLADGAYQITFDTLGDSEVESITVEEGSTVTPPPEPVREGYQFAGWYKDTACSIKWDFETDLVASDIVLYAGWTPVEETFDVVTIIAISANDVFGTVTGGKDYNVGDTVILSANPREGFRFVRWIEPDADCRIYSFVAKESRTLTAEFAPVGTPALSARSTGFDSITLTWTAVEGASGYEIFRSTQKYGTYSKVTTVSDSDQREFINSKLTAGKTYYYQIRAYCVSDDVTTYGVFASVSVSPRGMAVTAAAASAGSRSIQVTWNQLSGAGGYEIFRSNTKNGTYSKIGTASSKASSYTNSGLETGKTYYYKVRGFCEIGESTIYADFSATVSSWPEIVEPLLKAVPASATSNRLTWSVQTGISGYEIYRSTQKQGNYSKIYTAPDWPTAVYTNTGLTTNKTYYYKIRAFSVSDGTVLYGAWSKIQSSAPSSAAAVKERYYTIYYQGDSRWGFSSSVKSKACVLTSYAITINNMGISATPRTVYDSNGKRTPMNMTNLKKNFSVKAVCALGPGSEYLSWFDGHKTYIIKPSANAQAAIREALNLHPEGVILYFKSGSGAHAIVASKYDGSTIYFSDPGRNKGILLLFKDTWVSYHHRMTYANLAEMIALDEV